MALYTYLGQERHLRFDSASDLTFPASVVIRLRFAPLQVMGSGDGPVRAIRKGSSYRYEWDANVDRSSSRPEPGFAPVAGEIETSLGAFTVDGNVVTARFDAADDQELFANIQFLVFAAPAVLSARLPDPVHITRTDGTINAASFRLEHTQSSNRIIVLDDALLSQRVIEGLRNLGQLHERKNERIVAAYRYAHTAGRLLSAGVSPWEFMAESLLNYSKVLEVLFGDSRDEIRRGLTAIGYPSEEIEGRYIPITLLRDMLDVAHPRLAQVDAGRLQRLYSVIKEFEGDVADLLERMLGAVNDGHLAPAPQQSQALGRTDVRTLDAILAHAEKRRENEV